MKKSASKFIRIKHLVFSFLIGIVLFTKCKPPEEYSTTPAISFNNIELVDGSPLILTINFTDGDGDLGIESVNDNNLPLDALYPYHGFGAISDIDGKFITFSSIESTFPWVYVFPNDSSNASNIGSTDIRPSFSCLDYEIGYTNPEKTFFTSDPRYVRDDNPTTLGSSIFYSLNGDFSNVSNSSLSLDTVFVIRNEDRYNILVDFFVKKNGSYEEFDWLTYFDETGCNGIDYNGKFEILDKDSFGSSLEGTLSYSMETIGDGFRLVFKTDTLKLKVTIKDRNLNTSNTIDTPDFTLQQISK